MGTREKRIGIRELKSTLSECVREVRAGRTIVVTDHGQPVARLIPEAVSLRERVEALRKAGANSLGECRGDLGAADDRRRRHVRVSRERDRLSRAAFYDVALHERARV